MPEAKLALPCECVGTCGVAVVTVLEPWGDDPMETFIGFHQRAGYETLSQRARAAWRVLRGQDPWLHDVSLSVAQMRELSDFLHAAVLQSAPRSPRNQGPKETR